MIRLLTAAIERLRKPINPVAEAQQRPAEDVARRKLLVGNDYARRRQAALKATRA